MSGMVVALLIGLLAFGVLVVALTGLFLWKLSGDSTDHAPVSAETLFTPDPSGVRVTSTLRAVNGDLPDTIVVPDEDAEARFASTTHPEAEFGAAAAVLSASVDGRPVEPGATVSVSGATVEVEYIVGPRSDGTRVAYSPTELGTVEVVDLRATIEGDPISCLQPEGLRSNQDVTWVSECAGPAVAARRGPATAPGYSGTDIPAWVRVAYPPAG